MRQRLAGVSAHTRNPSVRRVRFALNSAWLLAMFSLFLCGLLERPSTPETINQAFSRGVQYVTSDHLTPGPFVGWIVLALMLASIHWIVLEFRAVMGGNIEVRPIDNASGGKIDTHALDVAFREYLALPRLYQLTTMPGDPEPEHLIEVLKVPSAAGWRGLLAAAYAYAFPRRAFIVSAALRKQPHEPMYGVAVQVRRLPGLATELETQWSTSFERALQRGAYAAVAHILPQTRACRNIPWSAWRGRVLPASLFRDYQRAKKMVAERRYDEALDLYHHALVKDANNQDLRYDVGQLYERLGLYPDALYTYLNLVDEIFPSKPRSRIRRSGRSKQGKYVIWYRYVVVMASGAPLAKELLQPDWKELQLWLESEAGPDDAEQTEERPLRTIELPEIRRLLAERFCEIYPAHTSKEELGEPLSDLLQEPHSPGDLQVLERCLLRCAESEARILAQALKWFKRRHPFFRGPTSLTLTAIREVLVAIQCRLALIDAHPGENDRPPWIGTPDGIAAELRKAGYKREKSANWLEHYNAACAYALMVRDDENQDKDKLPYAYAAVSALELALKYGEDIDFVRTKRYWLQAGDPDLAGLRRYACFRAFETRVYGRPLPATENIGKYELYLYLRTVLEDAARHLEREWRRRANSQARKFTYESFEEWWRLERHAWELAIRLGRFYRQWQTRREAVESRRNWIESFSGEVRSVSYPNVNLPSYGLDIGDFKLTKEALKNTEAIFAYLGKNCGRLMPREGDSDTTSIMARTREWSDYAASCSESVSEKSVLSHEVRQACEMRAAVWAALRHWALAPSREHQDAFKNAVAALQAPPAVSRRAAETSAVVPQPRRQDG
jgi:hypothetical protein